MAGLIPPVPNEPLAEGYNGVTGLLGCILLGLVLKR